MRATRLFVLAACLALAFWFAVPHAVHGQAPSTLDDYRRAVAQALALAQQAATLSEFERAPVLKNAADTLDSIHRVQTPAGASLSVDNAELVVLVRDSTKTKAAISRLMALRNALAQPLAAVSPADLAVLRGILSRPPFTETATDNWLQSLVRAIEEFLARLFNNTAQGVFDARDLLVVLGVLAVVVVLVYFLRNLRRNLVPEQALPPALMERDARTSAEAFDNAQRFINEGDYRSAVRQLYLATLLILDQRGRVKYDPTLTNREYLKQAAKDPRTTTALQPIVETFDRTWYGFEPITPQDFDDYRRHVEQVREL